MKNGPLVFLGILFTMGWAWYGLITKSFLEMGRQQPVKLEETGQLYPLPQPGQAHGGQEVYRANGCVECHTQQVRGAMTSGSSNAPVQLSTYDLARGWGIRPTVAQDFLLQNPVMIGSLRVGPDLANVGARLPDPNWHLLHLYNPRTVVPGSTMPRYPFLFAKQKVGFHPSPNALKLTGSFAPPPGYEIVPKQSAIDLAMYLAGLQAQVSIFEAPLPPKKSADTNAPAGDTNAPAGGTNAPAASTNSAPGNAQQ